MWPACLTSTNSKLILELLKETSLSRVVMLPLFLHGGACFGPCESYSLRLNDVAVGAPRQHAILHLACRSQFVRQPQSTHQQHDRNPKPCHRRPVVLPRFTVLRPGLCRLEFFSLKVFRLKFLSVGVIHQQDRLLSCFLVLICPEINPVCGAPREWPPKPAREDNTMRSS